LGVDNAVPDIDAGLVRMVNQQETGRARPMRMMRTVASRKQAEGEAMRMMRPDTEIPRTITTKRKRRHESLTRRDCERWADEALSYLCAEIGVCHPADTSIEKADAMRREYAETMSDLDISHGEEEACAP